ncbi:MAG: TetR/AcrR family transcriptional regulator [Candidatus Ventricola sp.]
MALPFTENQRCTIRQKLFESAQRHAVADGVQKTSLDTLTSEAGISKSSFYKFYESKEQLFVEVALGWETEVIGAGMRSLAASKNSCDKERAAAFVYRVFERIHQMGITRFLKEDLPYLNASLPKDMARTHYLSSARSILDTLHQEKIHFTASDEIVLSVIQLMYLSILNIGDIGENFFPALHTLVQSACEKLVA